MHAHKFLGLPKKFFLEFLPTYGGGKIYPKRLTTWFMDDPYPCFIYFTERHPITEHHPILVMILESMNPENILTNHEEEMGTIMRHIEIFMQIIIIN